MLRRKEIIKSKTLKETKGNSELKKIEEMK